jgi:hypothetical protein
MAQRLCYTLPSGLTPEDRDILRRLTGEPVPERGQVALMLTVEQWEAVKRCLEMVRASRK